MQALFIVMNETNYVDDILSKFADIGIKGATVLDSQGMGRSIVNNESLSTSLLGTIRMLVDTHRPYNKTIFTVIENDELVEEAVNCVKDIVVDIEKPGVGIMFTVPVGKVYGM